jgi:hypothetical protein
MNQSVHALTPIVVVYALSTLDPASETKPHGSVMRLVLAFANQRLSTSLYEPTPASEDDVSPVFAYALSSSFTDK